MGPIINEPAMETYEEASEEARKNGTIVTGGQRITEGDFGRGLFVEPTVVEAPEDSWLWKKELFVPFVAVAPFDELDEAIEKAERHRVRTHLGVLQRGPRPRSTSGSTGCRPASST